MSSLIATPNGDTGDYLSFYNIAGGDNMPSYMPRYLSDSGRVFFNSLDALVPWDINGQWDVYEYEPGGVGSCGQAQGCVGLISAGTSPDASIFRDASVTGDDVFFTTSDPLVAQDGDQSLDLYDAKADGGLAPQNALPTAGCGGEACKPPVSGQPVEQAPGSSGISGQGNLAPPVPIVAAKRKPQTRAQKLAQALKMCRSKPKRRRPSCVAQAKRRYGTGATRKTKTTTRARRTRNHRRAGR